MPVLVIANVFMNTQLKVPGCKTEIRLSSVKVRELDRVFVIVFKAVFPNAGPMGKGGGGDKEFRHPVPSLSTNFVQLLLLCTRYHQENTIERHRYGGAGWLVWGGIIFGSRTDLHVQSVTITGHIYRDVILEQHVRLFRGAMGAKFLFMDDNARPHRANIVDECLQSEDITRMDWAAYSPDLNPIEHVWD
ncbi:transposable element Tcb1 transposase [Trichonephila clavipes]|nr:transposable element Tcb1 transposase [Trichonephila clavipes]